MVDQSVEYLTEPRTVRVVVRDTLRIPTESNRKFMVGGEVGVPTLPTIEVGGVFKGNLILENKKGQIFSIGYDTEGRVWAGAAIKLFN
jgi:hypothetical protein